ncbi:hypothetical protein T484DRAFT_2308775 [Baffinella frigidus]|nr:hypothetical protein T484DRAFT_2308775 [Cryptophyta sp. CCMP2293]
MNLFAWIASCGSARAFPLTLTTWANRKSQKHQTPLEAVGIRRPSKGFLEPFFRAALEPFRAAFEPFCTITALHPLWCVPELVSTDGCFERERERESFRLGGFVQRGPRSVSVHSEPQDFS